MQSGKGARPSWKAAQERKSRPAQSGFYLYVPMDYRYTMPQGFMDDPSVPVKWRLYGIINGFWLSGKSCYGGNKFFSEKLGVGERQIRSALSQLQEEKLLRREVHGTSRNILPYGSVREAEVGVPPGGSGASGEAEVGVPHISDSNSDNKPGALEDELRFVTVTESDEERAPRKKPKYPNARTVSRWFRNPDPAWLISTTEQKCLELIYEWGEEKAKKRIAYAERNIKEDGFPIPYVTPYMIANNVKQLAAYAERNS